MFELLRAERPLLASDNLSFACWQFLRSLELNILCLRLIKKPIPPHGDIRYYILSHLTVLLILSLPHCSNQFFFHLHGISLHLTAILYSALRPLAHLFVWLPFFFHLFAMFGLFCPKWPFACVEIASWQSLACLFIQLPFLIHLLAMFRLFCPEWPFACDDRATRRHFTWPYGRASWRFFIWPCGCTSRRYWFFCLTAMIDFFHASWQYWFFLCLMAMIDFFFASWRLFPPLWWFQMGQSLSSAAPLGFWQAVLTPILPGSLQPLLGNL